MDTIYGKVWGKTRTLFAKNNIEIHRIEIKKGGFCSEHEHRSKYNAFFLESGSLVIRIWKDYGTEPNPPPDETVMEPGDFTTVSPGEVHQFEALEDCVAFEIYWTQLDPGDIQRANHGGVKE